MKKVISFLLLNTFIIQYFPVNSDAQGLYSSSFFKQNQIQLSTVLPASVATVEAFDVHDQKPQIFLIQDAHTNPSAQANISKTLELILQHETIPYVFVEGGYGDQSLSFLRQYGNRQDRERAAKPFLKTGELQGEEYLDLISDKPFTLWGVEDPELYREALEIYSKIVASRQKQLSYIKQINAAFRALREQSLNRSLLRLMKQIEKHRAGELPFSEYVDALRNGQNANDDFFLVWNQIHTLERGVDFSRAQLEERQALESLSASERERFQEAFYGAEKFTTNRPGEAAFLALLRERFKSDSRFPDLRRYLEYRRQVDSLDWARLAAQISGLESRALQAAALSDDERRWVESFQVLHALEQLASLKVTPDQSQMLRQLEARWDLTRLTGFINGKIAEKKKGAERAVFLEKDFEVYLALCQRFYELTLERDRAFVENIRKLAPKKSVFIVGGYHAEHLKHLFSEVGYSTVSILPQVLRETNQKKYESLLLGQEHPARANIVSSGMDLQALTSPARSGLLVEIFSDPSLLGARAGEVIDSHLSGARLSGVEAVLDDKNAKQAKIIIAAQDAPTFDSLEAFLDWYESKSADELPNGAQGKKISPSHLLAVLGKMGKIDPKSQMIFQFKAGAYEYSKSNPAILDAPKFKTPDSFLQWFALQTPETLPDKFDERTKVKEHRKIGVKYAMLALIFAGKIEAEKEYTFETRVNGEVYSRDHAAIAEAPFFETFDAFIEWYEQQTVEALSSRGPNAKASSSHVLSALAASGKIHKKKLMHFKVESSAYEFSRDNEALRASPFLPTFASVVAWYEALPLAALESKTEPGRRVSLQYVIRALYWAKKISAASQAAFDLKATGYDAAKKTPQLADAPVFSDFISFIDWYNRQTPDTLPSISRDGKKLNSTSTLKALNYFGKIAAERLQTFEMKAGAYERAIKDRQLIESEMKRIWSKSPVTSSKVDPERRLKELRKNFNRGLLPNLKAEEARPLSDTHLNRILGVAFEAYGAELLKAGFASSAARLASSYDRVFSVASAFLKYKRKHPEAERKYYIADISESTGVDRADIYRMMREDSQKGRTLNELMDQVLYCRTKKSKAQVIIETCERLESRQVKNVTLKLIAEESGIDRWTVMDWNKDHPEVAKATSELIRKSSRMYRLEMFCDDAMKSGELFTIREISEVVGIDVSTLYALMRNNTDWNLRINSIMKKRGEWNKRKIVTKEDEMMKVLHEWAGSHSGEKMTVEQLVQAANTDKNYIRVRAQISEPLRKALLMHTTYKHRDNPISELAQQIAQTFVGLQKKLEREPTASEVATESGVHYLTARKYLQTTAVKAEIARIQSEDQNAVGEGSISAAARLADYKFILGNDAAGGVTLSINGDTHSINEIWNKTDPRSSWMRQMLSFVVRLSGPRKLPVNVRVLYESDVVIVSASREEPRDKRGLPAIARFDLNSGKWSLPAWVDQSERVESYFRAFAFLPMVQDRVQAEQALQVYRYNDNAVDMRFLSAAARLADNYQKVYQAATDLLKHRVENQRYTTADIVNLSGVDHSSIYRFMREKNRRGRALRKLVNQILSHKTAPRSIVDACRRLAANKVVNVTLAQIGEEAGYSRDAVIDWSKRDASVDKAVRELIEASSTAGRLRALCLQTKASGRRLSTEKIAEKIGIDVTGLYSMMRNHEDLRKAVQGIASPTGRGTKEGEMINAMRQWRRAHPREKMRITELAQKAHTNRHYIYLRAKISDKLRKALIRNTVYTPHEPSLNENGRRLVEAYIRLKKQLKRKPTAVELSEETGLGYLTTTTRLKTPAVRQEIQKRESTGPTPAAARLAESSSHGHDFSDAYSTRPIHKQPLQKQVEKWVLANTVRLAKPIQRVLINDDDDDTTSLFQEIVKRIFPEALIEITSRSEDAIAKITNGGRFDFIISDFNTQSDKTGRDFIGTLRKVEASEGKHTASEQTPVFFFSGEMYSAVGDDLSVFGKSTFFRGKPVEFNEIVEALTAIKKVSTPDPLEQSFMTELYRAFGRDLPGKTIALEMEKQIGVYKFVWDMEGDRELLVAQNQGTHAKYAVTDFRPDARFRAVTSLTDLRLFWKRFESDSLKALESQFKSGLPQAVEWDLALLAPEDLRTFHGNLDQMVLAALKAKFTNQNRWFSVYGSPTQKEAALQHIRSYKEELKRHIDGAANISTDDAQRLRSALEGLFEEMAPENTLRIRFSSDGKRVTEKGIIRVPVQSLKAGELTSFGGQIHFSQALAGSGFADGVIADAVLSQWITFSASAGVNAALLRKVQSGEELSNEEIAILSLKLVLPIGVDAMMAAARLAERQTLISA